MTSTPRVRIFTLNNPSRMVINNELAEEIGLPNSIFLMQIEYLIGLFGKRRDGRDWYRASNQELRDEHFTFWSKATVGRIIKGLHEDGLLIVRDDFNRTGWDKTQWIALNLDGIAQLRSIRLMQPANLALSAVDQLDPSMAQIESPAAQNAPSADQSVEIDGSNRAIEVDNLSHRSEQNEASLRNKTSEEIKNLTTRDEIWNWLSKTFGQAATNSQKRVRTKWVNELRSAKATPKTLEREARRYRARFPNAALTEAALVKWYGQLDKPNLDCNSGSENDGALRCPHGILIAIDDDGPMCACATCDQDAIDVLATAAVIA